MRQHLTCVQAAMAVCGAKVEGAELGSQTLVFEPAQVRAGDYTFNVGTAGSCTLVLQRVLPALMLCAESSRVSLSGGTHNPMAPPFHFLERSFVPLLRRLGVGIDLQLRRLGFYPAGGGEISAAVNPTAAGLLPFDLTARGPVQEAYAECFAPALPSAVAVRELAALARALGCVVVARGGDASFTCTEMTEHATTNIGVIEQFLPVRFDVDSTGACPRVRVMAAAKT